MTLVAPTPTRRAGAPTGQPRSGRSRNGWSALGFLAPSGVGFFTFTLIPIVGSLALAFFAWPILGDHEFVGVANFHTLFTADPVFFRAMLNTTLFVVLYVPVNFVISLGIAVWISPRIRLRGLYRVLFFLPAVTPIVANALVWRLMLQPRGLVDSTLTGVFGMEPTNILGNGMTALISVVAMSVWQGFGYNMLVFSAGLDAINPSLYEAADIDGVSRLRQFWTITIPMLSPSMFFAAVLTLITSFQVFIQPYILTGGGPGVATQTMVMYMYQKGFQFFQLGMASSISTVLLVIIVAVTGIQFLGQRRFVHYDA
ncbi:MAG: carbohydrate ABC transporter permease [Propionibacteriaceae bacterium]